MLWYFLFTIIVDPKGTTVSGVLIEGEHKLRSQTLMFGGRGGLGCEVCHRVSTPAPPDTDVFQLQSQFPTLDLCRYVFPGNFVSR